jgi:hypothetical protein
MTKQTDHPDYGINNTLAESTKIKPETLESMYKSGDYDNLHSNPNLPDHIRREIVKKNIRDRYKLENVAKNPKIRLSDFTDAIDSDSSDEHFKKSATDDAMRLISRNEDAHPEDLHEIYQQTQGRYSDYLAKNPNTSEATLREMLKNGHARENGLIEHPIIGGKLYREREHSFPFDVPNVKKGNEINKVVYKPKQEKYQAAIKSVPSEGMDWATFKKEQPKLAADPDIQKMFISQPKQKLTPEAGQNYLDNLPGNTFHISYRGWTGMQRHDGDGTNQLCMQINNSDEHDAELKKNPKLFKLYKFVQSTSNGSGHPCGPHTIAWSRIDTSNPEHWFVDEAQSDMNSSMSKVLKEIQESGYSSSMKSRYGIDSDEAEELMPKLQEVMKNWDKAALNNIIELAKKHGVKRLSMHSGESKTAFNKPGQEVTNKYNKIYNESANAVGLNTKAPYSSIQNHRRDKGNAPIWTMDLSGEDVKKSTFTQTRRKSSLEILDTLIKFEISDDGKLVQHRQIKDSAKEAVARTKMRHYSKLNNLDTSFVDRLLRNTRKED